MQIIYFTMKLEVIICMILENEHKALGVDKN
jgi:hypothetical protein